MALPIPSNYEKTLLNTTETIRTIQINDILVKCIRKIDNLNAVHQTLEVSDFAKGIYFVSITTKGNLKQIKKLIVE